MMVMPLSPRDIVQWSVKFYLMTIVFATSFGWAAQQNMNNTAQWSGIIINGNCTRDEAFAEADKCTVKVPGVRLVLYDDTTRQIFDLEPQSSTIGHLGDAVTVRGSLETNTIHVSSLQLLTSIGLALGQKAPALSARDQYGREQTLEGLRGVRGTVLLFFRSADW
jgi:hypothetical protein